MKYTKIPLQLHVILAIPLLFHPLLTRREVAIDQWIGDKQTQSIQILLDAGRKGAQAAVQGTIGGVSALQNNAQQNGMTNASGVLGSIVSLASNAVSSAANTVTTTPTNQDETFETIDESEIISSSDEEVEEEESSDEDDEDYVPRRTRSSKKKD